MTLSRHTMPAFAPPRVGCVVGNRNHAVGPPLATGEGVLNTPRWNG